MIKNKRGLSAIVTTLMIILLVLVAVGIVWVVVKNIVESGVEDIDFNAKCINVDVSVKSAKLNGINYNITLERGTDSEEISGIYLLFTDKDSLTNKTLWTGEVPEAFGTVEVKDINPGLLGTPSTVETVVYFLDSSNQEKLCSPMSSYTLPVPVPVTP